MEGYLATYGLFALFCGSFLGATLLPLSSEALLVAGLVGGLAPGPSLLAASAGNTLACVFNYVLGYFAGRALARKLRRRRGGRIARLWVRKYGLYTMSLSWLPVVGDPLTVFAGFFRLNFPLFLLLVAFFRTGRYVLIVLLAGNVD